MTSSHSCDCGHPGCSGRQESACLCLHEHHGGLVHDQHCPACAGTGHPLDQEDGLVDAASALDPAPASVPARSECSEHEPIRAVVDVRLDEKGRPAVLLWWVECRRCCEVLDVPDDQEAVA